MAVPDPLLQFERLRGSNVALKITRADNEVTVTLNGELLYYQHFIEQVSFDRNLSGELVQGVNVLAVAVDNHGYPQAGSPAEIRGSLDVDGTHYQLDRGSGGDIRQGLFYLGIFIIEKP